MLKRLRRNLVVALVAFVAIWPVAQHALVTWSGGNPWYLFGMAMYTAPHSVVGLKVGRIVDGELVMLPKGSLTPQFNARLRRYSYLYWSGGAWAPSLGIPESLAAAFPDAEAIAIIAIKAKLDLETRNIVEVEHRLEWPIATLR